MIELFRPVFDHPICDESSGPVDWFGSHEEAMKAVHRYQEMGYFEREFSGIIESRHFAVHSSDGPAIAIVDHADGQITLWKPDTDISSAMSFWSDHGLSMNPRSYPGSVLQAVSISGIEKVLETRWPSSEKFVILSDGSCAKFQTAVIIHPSGNVSTF